VSLGPGINSPGSENRPSVTADGKYLFFTSNRGGNRDIYWVGTERLEGLRQPR
jgi:Tol biopolymer transport system component